MIENTIKAVGAVFIIDGGNEYRILDGWLTDINRVSDEQRGLPR